MLSLSSTEIQSSSNFACHMILSSIGLGRGSAAQPDSIINQNPVVIEFRLRIIHLNLVVIILIIVAAEPGPTRGAPGPRQGISQDSESIQ